MRVGLNRWVYASKKKEGRGIEHSPSRGGDKDGVIVGQTGAQSVVVGLELSLFLLTVSFSLSPCASEARFGNG